MQTLKQVVAWTAGFALAAASCMPVFAQTGPAPAATLADFENDALLESLLATASPRALILASMITGLNDGDRAAANAQGIELRERARGMAPDDAFVHWFVASSLADDAAATESTRDLVRIEPDNGAAWLLTVNTAAAAGDEAGVTDALARIGAAPRFNEYLGAMTLEWLGAIEAQPGATARDTGAVENSGHAAVAQPLLRAIAFSAAVAIPAYQSIVNACRANERPLEPSRRAACAAAGRMIATHATSLVSRAIGTVLLRHADDENYPALRRDLDYLSHASVALSEAALRDPDSARRFVTDWHETGNEIAVLERLLTRAGQPRKPPADWQPARVALAPTQY